MPEALRSNLMDFFQTLKLFDFLCFFILDKIVDVFLAKFQTVFPCLLDKISALVKPVRISHYLCY